MQDGIVILNGCVYAAAQRAGSVILGAEPRGISRPRVAHTATAVIFLRSQVADRPARAPNSGDFGRSRLGFGDLSKDAMLGPILDEWFDC